MPLRWIFITYGSILVPLFLFAFGWDLLGIVVRVLLFVFPFLRHDHTKKGFNFHLHKQSGSLGYPWGFGFNAWGRKFFYFHYYMGWSNQSEMHHRDRCTDPAYCEWHGNL